MIMSKYKSHKESSNSSRDEGPMNMDKIMDVYRVNDINLHRVDIYRDFVDYLCKLVFKTYMGDEGVDVEDKMNHFDYCYKKTFEEFSEFGYDLGYDKKNRYTYFRNFFRDIFYGVDDKDGTLESDIIIVWDYIFNYYVVKPEKDVYNFVELYKLFDNNKWYKN